MNGVIGSSNWDEIVRDSPFGGKGFFAVRDFDAGDSIITMPRPLVTALDNRRLKDTCANCYDWAANIYLREIFDDYEPPDLRTCVGCHTLRYCSKECQTESWRREHKRVCKLFGKLNERGTLPNAARAVLRMLNLAAYGLSKQALMDMTSHLNDITSRGGERAESLMILCTGIHEYSGTPFGMEYVQNFFATVLTNSLTIWTPTMDPLGIAVDPLASKANHSCDPNAVCVWDGVELQLRSLKPIKKDEEVFISYIDPTQPYSRRQHELDEKFYFKCRCSKCKLEWSGPNDEFLKKPDPNEMYAGHMLMQEAREDIGPAVIQEIQLTPNDEKDLDFVGTKTPQTLDTGAMLKGYNGLRFVQKYGYTCFKAATTRGDLDHMSLLNAGLEACLSCKIFPEYRQPVTMLRQNALCNYLIMAKGYVEAFIYAFYQALKLYFDCFPHIYPQTFHPQRVINKWTLVQLALVLAAGMENSKAKAIADQGLDFGVVVWGFLSEVLDNVEKSHGKGHRFAATVKRKYEEVRTDMTRDDPSKIRWAEGQIEAQWKVLRKIANDPEVNNFNQFQKEVERSIEQMQREGNLNR